MDNKDTTQKTDPEGKPSESVFRKTYDALSSVTLAIFLLISLAATSIVGTVVLQKGRPEQYLMEYGAGIYKLFHFLGLDDMYRSWWFLTLLILLLTNISLCSIKRFPRAWAQMTRSPRVLDEDLFKRMRYRGSVRRGVSPEEAVSAAQEALGKRFGKAQETREETAVTLLIDRGWYGRLGAYITHLSILILAVGAVYGGMVGFKGFVNIGEGQTIDRVPLRGRNAAIQLPFAIRCDDFRVEYYPDSRQPKDYYSDLVVLKNGQEIAKKRIEVNHPLIIDGIYFYQSSYGVDPNSSITLEVLDPGGRVAGPEVAVRAGQEFRVPGDPSIYVVEEIFPSYSNGMPGTEMLQVLGNSQRHFLVAQAAPDYDRARGGAVYFRLKGANIREYTGLQVAWDPGVPVVWLACFIMIGGLYITFFVAHRRVLVRVSLDADNTAVLAAGSTSRNPATFENEFEAFLADLREAVKGGRKAGKE